MTNVTYYMVSELPQQEDLVIGGIYYLTTGDSYIVKSDKSLLQLTNLVRVDTLPASGNINKLYLWVNDDKFKLFSWDGTKYIPMNIPDISQLESDIEDMGYTITNLTTNILTFADRLETVQDNMEAHVELKASEEVLGHVKVDGTTITIDSDGIISSTSSGGSIIDNNITAQYAPSRFANGHTLSNVTDNGFVQYFERVTGGSVIGVKSNFIVDTYRYDTSDTTHKYYQRITVFIGDDFVPREIIGYINRVSSSLSSWGSGTWEYPNFYSEDGLFPIKYALAGSKLNAIKENKKYVAIKSNSNILTNLWVEDKDPLLDVLSTFNLNASPNDYPVGITESYLSNENTGKLELIRKFNGVFNMNFTETDVNARIATYKESIGQVTQVAELYLSVLQPGKKIASMTRVGSNDVFENWSAKGEIIYGIFTPVDKEYGINGSLYYDLIGSTLYKTVTNRGEVTKSYWKPLIPSVVRDEFTPIEDSDDVYSAFTTENKLAVLKSNVEADLNTHKEQVGTDNSMGHVQVDGQTIKSEMGVISAKTRLNRIWESDPIPANATSWTVDYSDEPHLTDLNNYDFEVYDDGVLIFGNPITHVVDNVNKTVTFTPARPMPRAFTITCIGRGMEFY